MKVWIDGRVVNGESAAVPVTDHGFLYGDGLFEGIRVIDGRIFRLDDHLRRLTVGARAVGIELPDGLGKIVRETVLALAARDAYVRLIVTRGGDTLGIDPFDCGAPRVVCIAAQISLYPAEKRRRGIDLVTVSQRRPGPDVLDPRVKSLNYLNSVLARREAKLRGADEALILNGAGLVAEAAVANVFAVRDGALETPPPCDGALEGITRSSVMEIADELGVPCRERSLGRFDLLGSDEVFLTGAGAGIARVASLDGAPVGTDGGRPVTERIERAFPDFARRNGVAVGV